MASKVVPSRCGLSQRLARVDRSVALWQIRVPYHSWDCANFNDETPLLYILSRHCEDGIFLSCRPFPGCGKQPFYSLNSYGSEGGPGLVGAACSYRSCAFMVCMFHVVGSCTLS